MLPFLTPRIASLWVGLVTPIPSGLARPLVESLHCDAVMANHDVDTVIKPPTAGLTPYRQAVSEALARAEFRPSWDTGDAAQLPSDPELQREAHRAGRDRGDQLVEQRLGRDAARSRRGRTSRVRRTRA